MSVYNGSSNKTTCMYVCMYYHRYCTIKSVVTGIVYSWVVHVLQTHFTLVFLNCCPILGTQLLWYYSLHCIILLWVCGCLHKQYTGTVTVVQTYCLFILKVSCAHPSLLIAFLEVLPHLPLIVSYLMSVLVETQCCAVHNGKQCTISTPTLLLHINEPKFKELLLSA